jgi:hypothetical protein
MFTFLLICAMPLTEYLWDFDKFMRSGQDFELGLLSVATILCLVVVLLQQGKQGVRLALAIRRWRSFLFRHESGLAWRSYGFSWAARVGSPPGFTLEKYNLPIQV